MQDLVEFINANTLYVVGFMISGFAVLIYEIRMRSQNIGSLVTSVAVRVINSGAAIVDVRAAEQFADAHIADARNVPENELNRDAVAQNKNGTLLVCDTGIRSSAAAAKLRKEGIENVFSLQGGLQAWQQENLPVVRGES